MGAQARGRARLMAGATPEETPLARLLAAQIAASGPMRLDAFMSACLLHPVHGYYTSAEAIGARGDFVTAPEISQMFGEMAGLSLVQAWRDQGAPSPFVLAELGPGRGTLMADLLRAATIVPEFEAAARLHLVEASPRMRLLQRARLMAHQVAWAEAAHDLPEGPLLVVANEFLDALPIRQFQRTGQGWAERLVGLREGRLALGLGPERPVPALAHRLADTQPGDIVEHCSALPRVVAELGRRIAARGGAALIIDYGDWRSLGDTFQALRAHAPADPLAAPGRADLTAHVDFEAIARAAAAVPGLVASRPCPQGVWLTRLGIGTRAQRLAAGLSGPARATHEAALRRLTHPSEMGSLFKVIALTPEGAPPFPGLEPLPGGEGIAPPYPPRPEAPPAGSAPR